MNFYTFKRAFQPMSLFKDISVPLCISGPHHLTHRTDVKPNGVFHNLGTNFQLPRGVQVGPGRQIHCGAFWCKSDTFHDIKHKNQTIIQREKGKTEREA